MSSRVATTDRNQDIVRTQSAVHYRQLTLDAVFAIDKFADGFHSLDRSGCVFE
jgi:hypothetical protein